MDSTSSAAGLAAGHRIGRWTLLHRLGVGGVGTVWRARDPEGGPDVALKLLKIYDRGLAARQLREAELTARVRSPHVVAVREVFVHDGLPAMALELVEGPSLLRRLKDGRPSLPEVLALARAALAGLEAVHAEGLVHRDLKPGNLLLPGGRFRDAKLADFGLARALAEDRTVELTRAGMFLGTPGYAAPEQIRDPRRADGRADLFALGVVLYRMLVGRMPFAAADRWEVVERTREGDHLPLGEARPDLPPRVVRAIEGALEVDPDRRIPDAASFRAVLAGHRVRPPRAPALPREAEEPETIVEPTATGMPTPEAQNSWPSPPVDRLVGRGEELEAVHERLRAGARLVTLLGPAGAGKSRLAHAVARARLKTNPAPLRRTELAGARTEAEVSAAVGRTLGVRAAGGGAAVAVGRGLSQQRVGLLVLDGAEGASQALARLLPRWSEKSPGTAFLVTSRRLLGAPGERVVDVGGLPPADALRLFLTRAQAARPGFEPDPADLPVLETLLERLDRLPLAIELAAARARMLGPRALLDRLGARLDLVRRGGRGGGLDEAAAWSWSLLEPWGRAALTQLAAFEGGFTLEAAEAVLDLAEFPDAPWPMDVVQLLVDHSLIRVDRPMRGHERYVLYGTVRAYAADRAEQGPDADALERARARHARHFAGLGARSRMRRLDGPGGARRGRALWLERDNLRAAARRGIDGGEGAVAAGAALASAWLHRVHGPYADGAELLREALATPGIPPVDSARLHRHRGRLLQLLDRRGEAEGELDRALEAFRSLGDRRSEGIVLGNLADLAADAGDAAVAEARYEAALGVLREAGDRAAEGVLLGNLANLLRGGGELEAAAWTYEQALALSREVGDRRAEGLTLANLASLHFEAGRPASAEDAFVRAIEIAREVGDRSTEALLRANRAQLDREQGRVAEALAGCEEALRLAREVGSRRWEALALGVLGELRREEGDRRGAREALEWAVTLGDAAQPLFAAVFRGSLALVASDEGDHDAARRLVERAEAALRGVDPAELGKLLVKRGLVEARAGAPQAAQAAADEARSLLDRVGGGARRELERGLEAVAAALRSPA